MSSLPYPQLPPYLTLLLTGLLSPSLPIHVALDHLSSPDVVPEVKRKVVIVTARSRDAFERKLKAHDDAWLNHNALKGRWADLLSHVDIFYASTPAHLKLTLSLLRPSSLPNTRLPGAPAKVVLDIIPSLIILHDLSIWFTSDSLQPSSHILSNYLELMATSLDAARYLTAMRQGGGHTKLALVDGKLRDLRLPVVDRTPKPKEASNIASAPSSDGIIPDIEPRRNMMEQVLPVIARYFDWIGEVDKELSTCIDKVREDMEPQPSTFRLHLRRSTRLTGTPPEEPEECVFKWRESRTESGEFNGQRATTITQLDID